MCQWGPSNIMVQLYYVFIKLLKKPTILIMLAISNTFIVEKKICACRFMVWNQYVE